MADTRFTLVDRLDGVSEWRHRDNGLTLLVWPTPVAPVVGFGVVYRVGSRHEVTGHTGATHILEHLMFKGSRRFNRESGTEIARVLHRVGASFNATTWLDRTSYYEVLPVEQLPLAVDVEADRMRGALVRDEDLESERTVVLNELEMGENEPFELLMKAAFAQAYLEHPYRHPTIGWRGDVESVTGEVLRRFYDTYYHPDNAVALVVGDIDEAAALREVERGFGALPPAPAAVPTLAITESEQRGERRFEIRRAGELGNLVLTWHIPHGLHPDLPALSVLAQVLGDGVTSRLHRRLVETNRCLGVHAYALELHDPGVLQIAASLAPGRGAPRGRGRDPRGGRGPPPRATLRATSWRGPRSRCAPTSPSTARRRRRSCPPSPSRWRWATGGAFRASSSWCRRWPGRTCSGWPATTSAITA